VGKLGIADRFSRTQEMAGYESAVLGTASQCLMFINRVLGLGISEVGTFLEVFEINTN
jgi:hypothetical protein